jgi:hypothetical protein
MALVYLFRTSFVVKEASPSPHAANDNLFLMHEWRTPAELMQRIRRWRDELRRELAADFTLRACPKHRKRWDELNAMEACCRWHHFREQ